MKSRVAFLLAGVFVSLLLFGSIGWAQETVVKVAVAVANVRSKPDMTGPVIATVKMGTLLVASAKEGDWYRVDIASPEGQSRTGYINAGVVTLVSGTQPAQPPVSQPAAAKPEAPVTRPAAAQEAAQAGAPPAGGASKAFRIRPYALVGFLLTPPSATDLGYSSAGGTDLDQYLTTSAGNFGGGAQFLLSSAGKPSLRFGVDIGFRTLFSSIFDTGAADGSLIYEDYHKDREFGFNLLGIVEYAPPGSQFLLQGGLGGHFVVWSSRYVYESKYQSIDETDGGMEFNFGLMGAAGLNLQAGPMSIPILVRLDYIMRYRGFLAASILVGFTF